MYYSVDKFDIDELYSFPFEESREERFESLKDKRICRYRMKTIRSGDILECEIYPVWNSPRPLSRARMTKASKPSQKNLNRKNAVKKVIRLINANFGKGDIWGTFGYDNRHLPKTCKEATGNFQKFIRKAARYAQKHYENFEFKYLYVIEFNDDEKGKIRIHHHIVTNFPDRDIFERFWPYGDRPQTRRLAPDDKGLEGLARYIAKDPRGKKSFAYSKNLKKPIITVADYKITKKKTLDIATGRIEAQEFFEKVYKKYRFNDVDTYFSEFISGVYIHVNMKKEE